jgi:hypothetical protein
MANGRCQFHGGKATGAPKGNTNAFKHGLYSAEAVANRRKVGELLRAARKLVRGQREAGGIAALVAIAISIGGPARRSMSLIGGTVSTAGF